MQLNRFENEWLWPVVLGLLIGALLCGCETEARLQRWFEFKNQQLEQEAPR